MGKRKRLEEMTRHELAEESRRLREESERLKKLRETVEQRVTQVESIRKDREKAER